MCFVSVFSFSYGKKYTIFAPMNVYLISLVFVFVAKFIWLKLGYPLEPLGADASEALIFIAITNLYLYILYPISSALLQDEVKNIYSFFVVNKSIPGRYMIGAALLINIVFATMAGGSPFYGLQNPIEFRIFMQRGGVYYVEFLIFSLLIYGLVTETILKIKGGSGLFFLIVFVSSAFVALNSGLRGRFIEILLIPIVLTTIINKKIPWKRMASLALIVIPFVTLFGIYRDSVRENKLNFEEIIDLLLKNVNQDDNVFLPFFMHRFDAFDNFVKVLSNPPSGFVYLQSFVGLIAQPIPRFIWENKPHIFTSEMTINYNNDLFESGIALTFSAYSEAFLNFGFLLGPIMLAIFLAILLGMLTIIYRDAVNNSGLAAAYLMLYQLPFVVLSAGFINDISSVMIILTLIFLFLVKKISLIKPF